PPGRINRVSEDGFRYLAELGAVIFIAAGNDSTYGIGSPANNSRIYPNVISVGNFNHRNNTRRPSSNHHPRMSGVAPGDNVAGLPLAGQPTTWAGTSASSPHAAQLAARMMTGGHFTAMQVATALKKYTRDTGKPDSEQGGGAFDMGKALGELLKSSAASNPAVTARAWRVVSGPAQVGATLSTSATLNWTPTTAGIYTLRYSATHPAGTAT